MPISLTVNDLYVIIGEKEARIRLLEAQLRTAQDQIAQYELKPSENGNVIESNNKAGKSN